MKYAIFFCFIFSSFFMQGCLTGAYSELFEDVYSENIKTKQHLLKIKTDAKNSDDIRKILVKKNMNVFSIYSNSNHEWEGRMTIKEYDYQTVHFSAIQNKETLNITYETLNHGRKVEWKTIPYLLLLPVTISMDVILLPMFLIMIPILMISPLPYL